MSNIDPESPELLARYHHWTGVLVAFHDFVWEELQPAWYGVETLDEAWFAFCHEEEYLTYVDRIEKCENDEDRKRLSKSFREALQGASTSAQGKSGSTKGTPKS